MEADLYDEFGNYIGPELDSDEEDASGDDDLPYAGAGDAEEETERMDEQPEERGNQIVLHEDKKYYATALEVYGEGVETLVQEEDAQPLTEPIVKPVKQRKFQVICDYALVIPMEMLRPWRKLYLRRRTTRSISRI
jgi:U5 small nuclear ribonucleoprotein component